MYSLGHWGILDFKCITQHIENVTVYELSNSHDGKIHSVNSGCVVDVDVKTFLRQYS